jgi:hypothetical protein
MNIKGKIFIKLEILGVNSNGMANIMKVHHFGPMNLKRK